jgi:flagellar basal-body rod modification protein FlgD
MEVGSSTATPTQAKFATESADARESAMLDYDNFLQLLIAQMKNQDPTQPMDATEQVSQLATFSQVEQTIQTNRNLEMLLQSSALSEANAVIGRTVKSADGKISGVVKEVTLYGDGIVATLENGSKLAIGPGVTVS